MQMTKRRLRGLCALVLAEALLHPRAPAQAEPKAAAPPLRPQDKTMSYEFKLKLRESAVTPDGLRITFDSCSVEQIAAAPENPVAYPAGSGINVQLKLEKAGAQGELGFSRLSPGYDSKLSARWQGYEISLGPTEGEGSPRMAAVFRVVAVGAGGRTPVGATATSAAGPYPATLDYEKFKQNKARAQRIALAKELIVAQLGNLDFTDYPSVRVFQNTQAFRVEFRALVTLEAVNDRGVPPQAYVDVTVSAHKTVVTPPQPGYLYRPSADVRRVAKLFAAGETVVLTDKGSSYEARVAHQSSAERSGGTEAYSIDKATLAKKLLWHEHPQALPKISGGLDPTEVGERWVEIEK